MHLERVALLLIAGSATHCGAWALPPVKASLGGALANTAEIDRRTPIDFSVGVYPLQAIEGLRERVFDFGIGAGYFAGSAAHASVVAGPYVEVGAFVYSTTLSDWRLRVEVAGQGRMFVLEREDGGGVALRVEAELSKFAGIARAECASWTDPCSAVVAQGEGGIALYSELAYSTIGTQENTALTAGVTVRIPMSAGALVMSPLILVQALVQALVQ